MVKVHQLILICDRCGNKIVDTPQKRLRLTRFDKDYHGTEVDLCDGCWTIFGFWLDSPDGPPPGYKYQQRPCPHQIPCADPSGCSGKELVPV